LAQIVLSALVEETRGTDEQWLGMATALSASDSAYVFHPIQALVDAGVHIGLPPDYGPRTGDADYTWLYSHP